MFDSIMAVEKTIKESDNNYACLMKFHRDGMVDSKLQTFINSVASFAEIYQKSRQDLEK